MSGFGHDLLPTTNQSNGEDNKRGNPIGDLTNGAVDKVTQGLNKIDNDIANKLASAIGIAEWYSFHLMNFCQGTFEPDATASNTKLNVTKCTNLSTGYRINLTEMIDHELNIGPLALNLADLDWPAGIQRQVNKANKLFLKVLILYCFSMFFSSSYIIISVGDIFLGPIHRIYSLIGTACAVLGTVTLLTGGVITTFAASKGSEVITNVGNEIGVYAYSGRNFIVVSWVSFAMMAIGTIAWTAVQGQRYAGFREKIWRMLAKYS